MPTEKLPDGPLNKTKLNLLLKADVTKQTSIAHREGLGVRVYPKSTKYPDGLVTFQGRYRFNGAQQRIDYGHYPAMTLKEAEAAHRNTRRKVEQGTDPKVPEFDGTLAELLSEFINDKLLVEFKKPKPAINLLKGNIPQPMLRAKVDTITRRQVSDFLRVVAKRAPVSANRLLALVKQLFNFGVERGYLDDSPAAAITRRSVGGSETPKDRNLSFAEVKTLLEALPLRELGEPLPPNSPDMHEITKLALLFLLITGQRTGEVQAIKWSEVDQENRVWLIPAENSKNGKAHKVPLTPFAVNILRLAKDWGGSETYCFPSPRNPEKLMDSKSINRALQRHLSEINIASFTPHDLRRTFVSRLADLGIAPHVTEKCVNHSLGGVLAVYNHGEYWPERLEAHSAWDRKIHELMTL